MSPIILDTTTKSIQFKLGGTVTTNQLNYVCSYADNNGTVFTEGSSDGVSNNASAVTIVAAPGASTRRIVKSISIKNEDTVAQTMTVIFNDNATLRNMVIVTLNSGDRWTLAGTFDSSGNIKYSVATPQVVVATGKIVTVNNTLTMAGTDSTTMTFPSTSASIARTDAAQTFTGVQTLSSAPVLSTGTVTVSAQTVTLPAATDTLVARATTDTLTNKRVTKRVTSITSHATPTINTDNCDCVDITALAEAITNMSTNLSGTPTNKQTLVFQIKDNGTAYGITWGTSFVAGGVALPTTTVLSKILTVGFIYNTANSLNKWMCVASAQEA